MYQIAATRTFDFQTYVNYLINFNASGPFYYVCLYLQLMLTSTVLGNFLKNREFSLRGYVEELLVFVLVVMIGTLTTNHSNILGMYGGAGKLLGGTYLIQFYIGMLLARHWNFSKVSIPKSAGMLVVFGIGCFGFWRFICTNGFMLEAYFPFGIGFNPPGVTLTVFALLILFSLYGLCTLTENVRFFAPLLRLVSWFGQHTLYIFLYHSLVKEYLLTPYVEVENIWIRRVVYFSGMIVISILLEYTVNWVLKQIKQLAGNEN